MSWQDRPYSGEPQDPSGGSRFRDNPLSWAPSLGTIWGIRVQVHILFLLFIAVELLRAGSSMWLVLRYQMLLFGLVFLHEMGHCWGARRVGGSATNILMWPLGGLASVATPHRPGACLFTAAAGPLVNVAGCVLSAIVLVAGAGSLYAVPWNPFQPYIDDGTAALFGRSEFFVWVYQFFYVNYVLLLFNICLPMFPLDGGRMVQALCWYRMGYHRSMKLATTLGMAGAIALGCLGLFRQDFLLISIAAFGYIMCMQERRRLAMSADFGDQGYDLSAAYEQPDRQKRRIGAGAWARKQKQVADEQAEVDRILAKVSESGIQSLTRRERRTLETATQHQQEREREAGRVDRV